MPLALPLRRTKFAAEKVKKDKDLFGVDRQVGLGLEAMFAHDFLHGTLGGFQVVKLRGGALQYLEGGEWCAASAIDVLLSDKVLHFLDRHVRFMQRQLADHRAWVKAVGLPARGSRLSHGLWLSFWGLDRLVDGDAGLEHKFAFGRRKFAKRAKDIREATAERLKDLRGVSGQFRWLIHTTCSSELKIIQSKVYSVLALLGLVRIAV